VFKQLRWIAITAGVLVSAVWLSGCGEVTSGERGCYPVSRVVDGDTFRVIMDGGQEEAVRMLGVDTPETVKPGAPVEAYGKEASDFTKRLLSNQTVCLELDVQERDRYGRLLAYVYLEDGTFVNELIIAEGLAQVLTISPNVKYADQFLEQQRQAREAGKGLWSDAPPPSASSGSSSPGNGGAGEPDRDCSDFKTQSEAQQFFIEAGGPERDPHRLDRDGNGKVCETLPK